MPRRKTDLYHLHTRLRPDQVAKLKENFPAKPMAIILRELVDMFLKNAEEAKRARHNR
jgi:hypothetical protein